jgi:hypothetical protein
VPTHAFNVPKCFDLFEMDWPFCARKWDLRLCLNYSQFLANLKWSSLVVVVGKIYFHHDPCGGISKSLCQVYFCLVCVVVVFLKFKLMCSKVVRFHVHKQIYSHWWLKRVLHGFCDIWCIQEERWGYNPKFLHLLSKVKTWHLLFHSFPLFFEKGWAPHQLYFSTKYKKLGKN